MTLPPLLLEVLVCPDCKSTVTVDEASNEVVCGECGLAYPIRDGIPIMLISAARRPGSQRAADESDEPEDAGDADDIEASDDDAAGTQPSDS